MIWPIVAYGDPVLKKAGTDIDGDYEGLDELVANMFETMYAAKGVGLAAPQVALSIRLFVVDSEAFIESEYDEEDYPDRDEVPEEPIKRVFINPQLVDPTPETSVFNEGCLSIPEIREQVVRPQGISIKYLDQKFKPQKETFIGINARIVQHEFDHIQGVLFTDHLKPLKKRLLKKRLLEISKGHIDVKYKMSFPAQKR